MRALRAAVIGVGHLGQHHAAKYAGHLGAELVGVVDIDRARGEAVARELGVRAFGCHQDVLGQVDCVSIAVPTPMHFSIARDCLANGIDVLVEKPLTTTVDEGKALVEFAAHHHQVLQVGHLERFNPAIQYVREKIDNPRFIECHRLAPFGERGTDVDVVLDLMIHDLDIVLSLVPSRVRAVEAVGVPVLTTNVDIANARIRFANGCIANLTSSRVSSKRERKIRIFQPNAYIAADYDRCHVRVCHRLEGDAAGPTLSMEEHQIDGRDALADQIEAFLEAVARRREPAVSGWDGLKALEIAHTIIESMETEVRAVAGPP
jgi:predicted dehydrogenase